MKKRTVHFISGLPRAGSSLLANILMQNPKVFCSPTSACHDVLLTVRNHWNNYVEHHADRKAAEEQNLQRVLNAILHSYHDTSRPIVIDKGRGWLHLIEMAEFALGQKPKILVPVRDIPQILASFEKLHRKEMATREHRGDFFKAQTVEGRVINILGENEILGLAYNRLKDALARGHEDCLHFVEFEDLTFNPQGTLERVYDFLELEPFTHDFKNVEQVIQEDDWVHGFRDLHKIRKEVKPVKDDSVKILGKEIVKTYTGTEIWR